jgi:hypothetical protein
LGEPRLRVFENRVLRTVFGSMKDEMARGWRKYHEELHNLYSFPNICMIRSRRVEWVGHVAHVEEVDKCIQYFGWKVLREETT